MKSNDFLRLKSGTVQIIPEDALSKKLDERKPLRVKLGLDPTAPDLHLGHAVVLKKLKEFQNLGHEVIFLVGDFTARIGDPTGRSKTRPPLTEVAIAHNMQTYLAQAGKILDLTKTIIRYNAQWLSTLRCADLVKLCAQVTLARLTEREDFAQRIAQQVPIGFHELLYPLFQGYDSVALEADVELGGTDQTFNLLMGRFLQEHYGQQPQVIITLPLLRGLDGVNKMSKSLGNAIGIAEPAPEAFGKLMSISDDLMWHYFELLLATLPTDIKQMQEAVAAGVLHPMKLKKEMAFKIVKQFWSAAQAEEAQAQFEAVFQKRDYSKAQPVHLPEGTDNPLWIVDILRLVGVLTTSSEARRLIEQGALEVDGVTVTDFKTKITWQKGMVIKVGKHRIYTLA
jgi:tyrosyl-tRNA synthetase